MIKNGSGQKVGGEVVSATDGSAFTGAVTVYVTGDAGTQTLGSVGAGACTHEGNGFHTYAPAQAETNYDHIAFTFIGTGAVPATVQVYTTFPQTGDSFVRMGAAGVSLSGIPDLAGVTTLLARLTALRAGYLDNVNNAGLQTTVAQTGDTYALANGASGFVALKTVADAISTTIGAAGAGLTAVATAVWASATRLLTAGTNIALAKGVGVTGLNDLDAAGVRTAVGLASANLDTQLDALPTAGELATALAAADDAILAAVAALNNLSQANIRTAVGLGSANLDTQLSDLPTNAELATALGTADDAILVAIAALNNLSAAQVNAEVVDALATDTYAEPGQGAPGATISMAAKLGYLFKAYRNLKTGDGTTEKLYGDDGTTVHQKATTSEAAGVVTKGEVVSGP